MHYIQPMVPIFISARPMKFLFSIQIIIISSYRIEASEMVNSKSPPGIYRHPGSSILPWSSATNTQLEINRIQVLATHRRVLIQAIRLRCERASIFCRPFGNRVKLLFENVPFIFPTTTDSSSRQPGYDARLFARI